MKNKIKNTLSGIVFSLACLGLSKEVNAKFEMKYPATPVFEHFYSENSVIKKGDYIGVFVKDDNGKEFCVGQEEIKESGFYGLLSVYGDDTTTQIKDGARFGDALNFKIWDSETNKYRPTIINPQKIIYGINKWSEVDVFPKKYGLEDLVEFAEHWLQECNLENNQCNYFGRENEVLNLEDFSKFSEDYSPCQNSLQDFVNFWLQECNFDSNYCNCLGRPNEILNFEDFSIFSENYLE